MQVAYLEQLVADSRGGSSRLRAPGLPTGLPTVPLPTPQTDPDSKILPKTPGMTSCTTLHSSLSQAAGSQLSSLALAPPKTHEESCVTEPEKYTLPHSSATLPDFLMPSVGIVYGKQ